MDEAVEQYEQLLGAILSRLEPPQRRSLARRLARELQRRNSLRIARQRNPDDTPFAPRSNNRRDEKIAGPHPVRFLYRSPGSPVREVSMRSWRYDGNGMTGYDIEVEDVRTFLFTRIIRFLPDDAGMMRVPPGRLEAKRGRIRRKAMFARLRQGRFLKSGATDREIWVGFAGRVGAIANQHHHGLKVGRAQLPKRGLVGASADDREALLDLALEHIVPA